MKTSYVFLIAVFALLLYSNANMDRNIVCNENTVYQPVLVGNGYIATAWMGIGSCAFGCSKQYLPNVNHWSDVCVQSFY